MKDDFDIVCICWDHGLPKIEIEGARVVYVSREGNIFIRSIRFLKVAFGESKEKKTIAFIKYFKGISLAIKLLVPFSYYILDIRSGATETRHITRFINDGLLKITTYFFENITVISEGLSKKLGLYPRAHVLPLGAESLSIKTKQFHSLNLLYVGNLYERRKIINTVWGIKKFYDEYRHQINIKYTIVGDGKNKESENLKKIISDIGMEKVILVEGYVQHDKLKKYFDDSNIGVSYIPITEYYDHQPPTKTYEYLLSGMAVIATNTTENRKVIKKEYGVLIGDSVDDFYRGLKAIYERRESFDSDRIRRDNLKHSWENIVKGNLLKYSKDIQTYSQ